MVMESDSPLGNGGSIGDDEQPESRHRGFWRFWLSLPGLLAAVATLVTALTALAALFVHQNQVLDERTVALDQATSHPLPTVTVTATVTAAPELPTIGTGPDSGFVDSAAPASTLPLGSRYLADLEPVDWSTAYSTEAAVLSNRSYPRSVSLYCDDGYVIYNTSGSSQLTVQLGVADNASEANGAISDIAFYDQDDRKLGKTVVVSLAHPARVTLDLAGVVQTKITCSGRDRVTDETRQFYVTLGDAALIP